MAQTAIATARPEPGTRQQMQLPLIDGPPLVTLTSAALPTTCAGQSAGGVAALSRP